MEINPHATVHSHRRGFTMIELMVVVGIMLLLTAITLVSINFGFSRDRVRGAARQIQSFIAGARDRAIHAKEVRGVRLILHPTSNHVVTAMQYIGAPDRLSQGKITFPVGTADRIAIPNATLLQRAGLLGVGSPIEIPKDSGIYFVVASRVTVIGSGPDGIVTLNRSCSSFPGPASGLTYTLTLRPTIIAGSEPVQLPAGVGVDLDASKVPSWWRPTSNNSLQTYSKFMDILFNPRGNVIGDAASIGGLHFAVADTADIGQWRNIQGRVQKNNPSPVEWSPPVVPVNPSSGSVIVKNEIMVVSLSGRSGNVGVHPIDASDSSPVDSVADDPYRYAETGGVSTQ